MLPRTSAAKPLYRLIGVVVLLSAAGLVASAQVPLLEPKYEQPPEIAPPPNHFLGWNQISMYGLTSIAADDWICTTPDPVTEVCWWGSYVGWVEKEPPLRRPTGFHLAIWTNQPNDPFTGFSRPARVIWEYTCYNYEEVFFGWDYDPRFGMYDTAFQYRCVIPRDQWFYQPGEEGIYWLSIAAIYECPCDGDLDGDGTVGPGDVTALTNSGCFGQPAVGACAQYDVNCDGIVDALDRDTLNCLIDGGGVQCCPPAVTPEYPWGWKTRDRLNDPRVEPAVEIFDPNAPVLNSSYVNGQPIFNPQDESLWDLAFELKTQKVVTDVKWDKPPVFNPESQFPNCFWGWDEFSQYAGPQIAADDYVCADDSPVTRIEWWGSYIGYQDDVPPDDQPVAWVLSIWEDIPAGVTDPFSHPGDVMWQVRVPADRVQQQYVGCDFHPLMLTAPESTYMYTLTLTEEEYFYQPGGENILWLSIAPIYAGGGSCECNADFNGDGVVDDSDAQFFFGNCPGAGSMCDLNCDGVFDTQDQIIFDCLLATGGDTSECCPDSQPRFPWGWLTRPFDQMAPDAAIRIFDPTAPFVGDAYVSGSPLVFDGGDRWFDLSFRLFSEQIVGEDIKWSQPPIPWDEPVVLGWDEYSLYDIEIAADDWLCRTDQPVIGIRWLGSFLNWFPTPNSVFPPVMPRAFHLAIWTDVPAGVSEPFSHPGRVVWEYTTNDYSVVPFLPEADPCMMFQPREFSYEFRSEIPEDAWFWQDDGENIYWLSIAAIYEEQTFYPFGWATVRRSADSLVPDAAIKLFDPIAPTLGSIYGAGAPIVCNDVEYDLVFGIDTCLVCGDMNCDGSVDTFDIDAFILAISAPAAYVAQYPNCNILHADCNSDGQVDTFDIDAFIAALSGGQTICVYPPGTPGAN